MNDNARYYVLNFDLHQAYGVGSLNRLVQRSLLDEFIYDGVLYPELTPEELSRLSDYEYEKRVRDFLKFWNVTDEQQVNDLVDDSEIIKSFVVYVALPLFDVYDDMFVFNLYNKNFEMLLNENLIGEYITLYAYANSEYEIVNIDSDLKLFVDSDLTIPFNDGYNQRFLINTSQDLTSSNIKTAKIKYDGTAYLWENLMF